MATTSCSSFSSSINTSCSWASSSINQLLDFKINKWERGICNNGDGFSYCEFNGTLLKKHADGWIIKIWSFYAESLTVFHIIIQANFVCICLFFKIKKRRIYFELFLFLTCLKTCAHFKCNSIINRWCWFNIIIWICI